MRQNSLSRSLIRLALVLMISLFGNLSAAAAVPNHLLLQSEESFQVQLGDRAVQIAEGVYRVELPSGEQIRVAFGNAGLKHDIAWFRAEISTLQAQLARDPKNRPDADRLRLLKRGLARLEQHMAERRKTGAPIQSMSAHIADNGLVCSGYGYHLDGGHNPGLVGGTTWGEASVGPDGFSPSAPVYRCVAYSYVGTTDGYGNFFWDEKMDDQLGSAWTSTTVDCGYSSWWCPTWESYNWIQNYGCSDGFRSIYRSGSN